MFKQISACVALILLSFSAHTDEEQTTWVDTRVSMTRLLNDGWAIQGFSTLNTNWHAASGWNGNTQIPRESPVALPGNIEATFILTKNGKWIWCGVTDPSVANGARSNCRYLN